jgi:cell well associated rhsD protein
VILSSARVNLTAAGTAMMTNKYQYNAVDNILGITNTIDPTRAIVMAIKSLVGIQA